MPARKKPNALKVLHGARAATINRQEPKFRTGSLECPSWLPPAAQEEWQRLISEFADVQLITAVDQAALAAFVQSFALWQQASVEVEQHGLLVKEPVVSRYTGEVTGYRLKKNPAATVMQQERAAMLAAGRLFGFDPASRSAIRLPESDGMRKPDELDDINDYSFPADEETESVQ